MTKYYTRNGDDGLTTWLGKGRITKYDLRFEALGSLDEASASLGLARSLTVDQTIKDILLHIQRDLSGMMGEVAADPNEAERFRMIQPAQVAWLEEQADTIMENIEPPRSFVMSGDTPGGGALDLARTTVRRAERNVVHLSDTDGIRNLAIIAYLNRLSALLFVLELLELKTGGLGSPSQAGKPEK